VDALKIVSVLGGERGTGFPDFFNDGIFLEGGGWSKASGVGRIS
jgi:hypothetical protein